MMEIEPESTAVRAAGHHYVDGRCTVCGASLATNKIALPQTGGTGSLQPLFAVLHVQGKRQPALGCSPRIPAGLYEAPYGALFYAHELL